MITFYEELETRAGIWYEYLYSHRESPEVDKMIDTGSDVFDVSLTSSKFAAIVDGYAQYRQDPLSSDIETAAFMLAYWDMVMETVQEVNAR